MPQKDYLSMRKGTNPNPLGFSINDLSSLFNRLFTQMSDAGYFHEAFGFCCVDADYIPGKVVDGTNGT
jgi:hypothetical protein